MRHVALTIREDDLDAVFDRLLPVVPQGVHHHPAVDGRVELGVYGDAPGRAELEAAVGDSLLAVEEHEAPDDSEERRRAAQARRPPIGGRVVVRREGTPPAAPGLVDVVIGTTGGAFGAGTHPTTELCLELMLELEPGGSFADLGSGTGLLAIAAAKLGWAPLIAIDHEPAALEATAANARRNGVDLDALQADLLQVPPPPAQTLAANVPVKVHEWLAERLAPDTRTVLISGVVDDHLPGVVEAYGRAGLELAASAERRGWTAAVVRR